MTKFKAGDKVWDKELEKIVTLKKFIREIISHEPNLHFIRYWEVEEDTENLYAEYNLTDTADTMLTRLGFVGDNGTYKKDDLIINVMHYPKPYISLGTIYQGDIGEQGVFIAIPIDYGLHQALTQLMVEMEAQK